MTEIAFNERVNALAAEYWNIKEKIGANGVDGKRKELEEVEKLLEKGITGKLRLQLEEEARRLRAINAERENASVNISRIVPELIELTSDFAPSLDQRRNGVFPYDSEHEPISAQYYRAVTDILFNEPTSSIQFKNAIMSGKGIEITLPTADNLTALSILNYITTILEESAKKVLGRANQLDSSWKKLKEKDYAFVVFSILVKLDSGMSLKELQEICDMEDGEYKGRVTDLYDERLEEGLDYLTQGDWDLYLVEKHGDKYAVTDFGKWVWRLCGGEKGGIEKEEAEASALKQITKFIRKRNVDRSKHR